MRGPPELTLLLLLELGLCRASLCPPHLSTLVPEDEGRFLADGSLVHGALVYPASEHWRDGNVSRGCVCSLGSRPCLRKCCGLTEVVTPKPSRSSQCAPRSGTHRGPAVLRLESTRVAPEMGPELATRPDLRDWFNVFPSPRCAEGYVFMDLEPDLYTEDEYRLQANGSLWLPTQGLLVPGRFCMDARLGSERLAVIACLSANVPEDETPTMVRVGYLLSVPFLALTLLVYGIIPELRNIYGKTLMCYVASLLAAYSSISLSNFFLFGTRCLVTAYIVHFSFLASFFWLNVMCFDIWWTFGLQTAMIKVPNHHGGFRSLHGSVKQRERKKFIMYSIYAWGCASILTIICMIMDMVPGIPAYIIRPKFGNGRCWFESHAARAIYFYGPMGVTVLCNTCLFILTAFKIMRHKKDTARQLKGTDSRRHDDNKQWFNLYLKLFIVMGIIWSMEIISWLFEDALPNYVWYITDLANTLHGVIIFVIFVCKNKVKRLLMKRFSCQGNNMLFCNSTNRSGCTTTSTTSRMTCVTAVPLQEKINPYAESKRPKPSIIDESNSI